MDEINQQNFRYVPVSQWAREQKISRQEAYNRVWDKEVPSIRFGEKILVVQPKEPAMT